MLAFHGIGAYRGGKNPLALRNALNVAMSGVEICAADRPIKAFGMIAEGEVTAVTPRDCWSEVKNGERTPTESTVDVSEQYATANMVDGKVTVEVTETVTFYGSRPARHLPERVYKIKRKTAVTAMPLVRNPSEHYVNSLNGVDHNYAELFFKATQLKAIWVKSWADDTTKAAAKILAKSRGVPMIIVNGTDRIADIASKIDTTTAGNGSYTHPTIGDLINA
jgi:hypothetical protein